jgi:hypothetical protein
VALHARNTDLTVIGQTNRDEPQDADAVTVAGECLAGSLPRPEALSPRVNKTDTNDAYRADCACRLVSVVKGMDNRRLQADAQCT